MVFRKLSFWEILEQMLTPNFEVARIIARYLPDKGKPFDPARHLTVCRDMTGNGILAIEELAQDSGVDIYLDAVKFHDESIAEVPVANPTAGTNGAIVMAAMPELAPQILAELKAAGYREPWLLGRVEQKSATPQILLNERLKRYSFLRGVHKGIFERSTFVPPLF